MKNTLFSTSIAAILVSTSLSTFAGPVTIPHTFVADTPAVAAEVNANFSAVETAVDGNAGDIGTNTTAIGNNTTAIGDNTTAIGDNTTAIQANEAAITTLQGGSTCPADMVAVGSLCVDKYEASIYSAATGGTKFGNQTDDYPCDDSGSDCGVSAANPIFARSVAGEPPATNNTVYQAAVACANVGKRLPTITEWQMAAAGTPSGTVDCNGSGAVANTGSSSTCVSSAGAFDMVGNVWEWSADLQSPTSGAPTTTDSAVAVSMGDGYFNNGNASTKAMWPLVGPNDGGNPIFGFRCVK